MSPDPGSSTSVGMASTCACGEWKLNRNVTLALVLVTIIGIADSIWAGTALAAYLYILSDDSNSRVGFVEAASGLSTLIAALPVGYLADRYGRSIACRVGGVALFVAIAMTVVATIQGSNQEHLGYTLMVVAMMMQGLGEGVVWGPVQALYADSIPTGERSKFYVYLFGAYLVASCAGPAMAIGVFQIRGNTWSLGVLRQVIYVGLVFEFFAACMLFLFRDSDALGAESDHVDAADDSESRGEYRKFQDEEDDGGSSEPRDSVSKREANEGAPPSWWAENKVPAITFAAGLVMATGSGMTVKFFPLFFKNDCHLSPSAVQGIYVAVPLIMAAMSGVAQRLASFGFGRVQTLIVCKGIGVAALLMMVLCLDIFDAHWYVLVALYLFRTGIMNCTYPLEESITMDFVPKSSRARWKSLESVAQFGWCGSAALGGILADRFDYSFTFQITACTQGVGIFIFALLIPLVPKNEQSGRKSEERKDTGTRAVLDPPSATVIADDADSEVPSLKSCLLADEERGE